MKVLIKFQTSRFAKPAIVRVLMLVTVVWPTTLITVMDTWFRPWSNSACGFLQLRLGFGFGIFLEVIPHRLVAHARAGIRHAIPALGLLNFPGRGDAALLKLLFPSAVSKPFGAPPDQTSTLFKTAGGS